MRPDLSRTYTLATPAGRTPDAATEVVIDALTGEARRMIEAGEWNAQWLGRR